jgi:hypothetical protein
MICTSFKNVLKALVALAVVGAPTLFAATNAQAQSPAPIGLWQGQNSGDYIRINTNGSCSATGTVNVAGRCEWLPTSAGGVLNMYYPMPLAPGRIGWSVIWINRNTIRLNGVELFVRRG